MKKVLNQFSKQSEYYKKFRPTYPLELYDEILQHLSNKDACWDCGTGNGQVALVLAKTFKQVFATDISAAQLSKAKQKENIIYKVERAEQTSFAANSFDLITVGQAIHWFDFSAFNKEVKRVAKKEAILAVWGYGLLRIDAINNSLIDEFYHTVIGKYWNVERKHIDNQYQSIPLDFEKIAVKKKLAIQVNWNLKHLEGYFNSWSSVQNYIQQTNKENPVPVLIRKMQAHWTDEKSKPITFPIFLKLGRIVKC